MRVTGEEARTSPAEWRWKWQRSECSSGDMPGRHEMREGNTVPVHWRHLIIQLPEEYKRRSTLLQGSVDARSAAAASRGASQAGKKDLFQKAAYTRG